MHSLDLMKGDDTGEIGWVGVCRGNGILRRDRSLCSAALHSKDQKRWSNWNGSHQDVEVCWELMEDMGWGRLTEFTFKMCLECLEYGLGLY